MFKGLFNKYQYDEYEILCPKDYRCKICGKDFELEAKNKYIAIENKGLNGSISGLKKFECFDCPKCGCQNIVNVREGEYNEQRKVH